MKEVTVNLKGAKFWIKAVSVDVATIGGVVAGTIYDNEFLLSASIFGCWFFTVLSICFGLLWKALSKNMDPQSAAWIVYRTRVWKAYDFLTCLVLILLLAGAGYFFLPGMLIFGRILFRAQVYTWLEEQDAKANAPAQPHAETEA